MQMAEAVRLELRAVSKRVNLLINKILSERDMLALQAADEVTAGEQFTVKPVTYDKKPARIRLEDAVEPMEIATGKLTPAMKKGLEKVAAGLKKTEMSASAALAKVDASKKRRVRAPLPPERKAKAIAALAKARAAKKAKQ